MMAITREELLHQVMTISTAQQCLNFAHLNNIPPVKEDLPDGGSAVWFGSPSANRVLAYIPGGALVVYASPMQISLAYDMYDAASLKDDNVALVILCYDTCLTVPYPAQLRQTVAFVNHLLKKRDAEDIELFGDSAGGALIIALLLHIAHPHPKVPQFAIPSGHNLGRILLISPSGPVVTSTVATSKNIGRDGIDPDLLRQMWSVIEGNHDTEVDLINPWLTPAYVMYENWYEAWPAGKITIVIGSLEILEEDLVRISKVIKAKHHGPVDVHLCTNSTHGAYVGEALTGAPRSQYTVKIMEWAEV